MLISLSYSGKISSFCENIYFVIFYFDVGSVRGSCDDVLTLYGSGHMCCNTVVMFADLWSGPSKHAVSTDSTTARVNMQYL